MTKSKDYPGNLYHRNPASQRGFTAVPNDLLDATELSTDARFLYILLKRYSWKHGHAWPGQVRLGDDMGVSDRTIRTYLAELTGAGLLTIEHRGNQQTNIYWLEDPPEPKPEVFAGAPPSDRKPTSGPVRMQGSGQGRKPPSAKEDKDGVEENKGEEIGSLHLVKAEDITQNGHQPPQAPTPPVAPPPPKRQYNPDVDCTPCEHRDRDTGRRCMYMAVLPARYCDDHAKMHRYERKRDG